MLNYLNNNKLIKLIIIILILTEILMSVTKTRDEIALLDLNRAEV